MSVRQLGYLVFDVAPASLEGMKTVFQELFEAPLAKRADGSFLVRLDGRPFRIMLREAATNRLAAIGWDAGDAAELRALATRLTAAGISQTGLSPAECADRNVAQALRFHDPDGFPLELFVDQPFSDDPETGAKFVCGQNERGAFGLGHLVQMCRNREATQQFYTDVLGFRISDRITWAIADLFFLHCNQRHHSLALSDEAFGLKAGMIDHFMIEARSKEQVDAAYERLAQLGMPVSQTLGQHTNDKVYSFYMGGPMGFRIEFGFGGKIVEDPDNWDVIQYDAPSEWGHELVHHG